MIYLLDPPSLRIVFMTVSNEETRYILLNCGGLFGLCEIYYSIAVARISGISFANRHHKFEINEG